MTNNSELPEHIKARYGVKNSASTARIAAMVVTALIAAAIMFAIVQARSSNVASQLLSFHVKSPTSVDVTWEISRAENTTTYCAIRAQDDARTDVGYAIVTIPAGESHIGFTYGLTTESLAVVAEVLGCGQTTELRVPPAQFPPGVQPPAQIAPGVAPNAN